MGELHTKINLSESVANQRMVTMSNALTRAGHGLSLPEKRIVFIAISKINPRKPLPVDANGIYASRITAAEYAKLADCEIQTAYQALKEAAKALYSRSITFFEPAYKRKNSPLRQVHMRWVGKVHYQEGEGWAELLWWPEVLPHLSNLSKHFSSYQLRQATGLRSIYSWKLLELLNRFKDNGWAEYTIEDFAVSMEATTKQQADFGKMRTKIIEPAVKELTEKDGWTISWEAIKAGRKVKTLRFEFQRQKPHPESFMEATPSDGKKINEMPSSVKPKRLTKAEIEAKAYPGESYAQAATRLKQTRQTTKKRVMLT